MGYMIVTREDGKYACVAQVQDSTERWVKDSLEAAISSMIKFAKVVNGTYITQSDIVFLRPVPVVRVLEYEEWKPEVRQ